MDYHEETDQRLDSCLCALIALFMLVVLVLTVLWVIRPFNDFLRNVGPNISSILKSNERHVMSWPLVFSLFKVLLAIVCTEEVDTVEGIIHKLCISVTLQLFVSLYTRNLS
jgi:hypothetical protein